MKMIKVAFRSNSEARVRQRCGARIKSLGAFASNELMKRALCPQAFV